MIMSEAQQFSLKPEMQAEPGETKFLDLLNASKKVIFDWGYDNLWVVENNDETKPENCHSVMGERFHELTGTSAGSSADTVISLLRRGIDVDVRGADKTFKTPAELEDFMKKARQATLESDNQ
jgi:hypothetical protein